MLVLLVYSTNTVLKLMTCGDNLMTVLQQCLAKEVGLKLLLRRKMHLVHSLSLAHFKLGYCEISVPDIRGTIVINEVYLFF